MKYSKKILTVLLCAVLTVMPILTGCSGESVGAAETKAVSPTTDITEAVEEAENAEKTADEIMTAQADTEAYAATITLNGSTAEISGSGAAENNGDVVISGAGSYLISGTLDDGRIVVDAQGEDVILMLNGASLSCSYSSPLYIYKSASTTLVLADGTVNTLSDGGTYSYADSYSSADDGEPNACLYSKSDLMITGNGELNINAAYNNGITGKDTLQIVYANVNVSAANNGITGKDCVIISGASATVDCNGNGIASSNDTDETLGYITLTDSAVTVNCTEDGIDAETGLTVTGGTVNITTTGGTDVSAKGLKAGSSLLINSGEFSIASADDAIHSQGDISISGGSFTLSSGDDGIHADDSVTISDGSITITESYEGIEGSIVNIAGGTISVNASDDGINAAGGADQSGFGGRGDSFNASTATVNISGGVTYITADGDGIDSNGSLNVTGGELYISGPTNDGNSAIDYESTGTVSGGKIVAVGSAGMAMNFGGTSTQGSILVNLSGNAGDTVTLTDAQGNTLVSYTAQKRFESVLVSSPELAVGETYTVTTGSGSASVTLDSLIYGASGMGGGMMPFGDMGGGKGGGMGGGKPDGNMEPLDGDTQPPEGGMEPPEGGMGPGSGGERSDGHGGRGMGFTQ